MTRGVNVAADLSFEVTVPDGRAVRGTLRGNGNRLLLDVDDPGAFAGGADAPMIRTLADTMASRGIVVQVTSQGIHLVTIGATSASWWQRRATGSRHIRLGSLRGAWTSARSRARDTAPLLPDSRLAPPSTMFPLAPTFRRRPGRGVTTTHDPARGGGARLVLALREDAWGSDRQSVYWLNDDVTRIGSNPACDISLPGLDDLHAEIQHDDRDEFVLVGHGWDTRVHGARVQRQILRTGTRVEVGRWQLAFYREEFADHGRPYGGRIGGEFGHQRPQPPRDSIA